jgi:RNA-directed DNA polymerase
MAPRLINGQSKRLENWSQINWRKATKTVKNLRKRIFRARELGNFRKLRNLQKLMLRSQSNLLLSIKQITQINKGKQTAGVDKEVIETPQQRVKLALEMANTTHIVKPTKRIHIPKSNGKTRPLGIPTIKDRVMQAVVKNLLEPEWEAMFEENSYGFRPGRSCQDAIAQAFIRMAACGKKESGDTWILDADISGFFDNISHEKIEEAIGNTPGHKLIKSWLKSGFMERGKFNETHQGTPQGGVISPLLANIGLHGLEKAIKAIPYQYLHGRRNPAGMGIIRYADDFIVSANSEEAILRAKEVIEIWLKDRNLELSEEKTRIVRIDDGFDFLGFNIRRYREKALLIRPSKEKVLSFCKDIGLRIKFLASAPQEKLIKILNPILRGFANFYRGVVSKDTFDYIKNRVWKYLWRWAIRRHPNKGKEWIRKKYFATLSGIKWTFATKGETKRSKDKWVVLFNIASTPIIRHIKVKGRNSPDNPQLKKYWDDRAIKTGKIQWAKGGKLHEVAENQDWVCPICGDRLFNNEKLEIHHIVPVAEGGTDDAHNLLHLHTACHKQEHLKIQAKITSYK